MKRCNSRNPEALKAQGIEVLGGTPAELRASIARDIDKWRSLIEAAGLKE